ncbi:receptor-transporting protein 3-like [Pelobates fuscus]|uniref:receptor-transporting protein 3-like n=1 Tax=Pelobates fuscus TaxID=191477 RepID=UPI002FE4D6E3
MNMESVWKAAFDREIEEQGVPHRWTFTLDDTFETKRGWLQYMQCTFGRFCCSCCSRWWNSAQVHIAFMITSDRTLRHGKVKIKIFRQKCKRCSLAILENPEISHENIQRVIHNLVNKIQRTFYLKNSGNPDLQPIVYSDYFEGPHEQAHCEACKLQVCPWQTNEKKPQKPVNCEVPRVPRLPVYLHRQTNIPRATYGSSFLDESQTNQEEPEFVKIIIVILIVLILCVILPNDFKK